jgi:DNA-binding NarL/FixJ family response regulator
VATATAPIPNIRVLVVDDQPSFRSVMREALEYGHVHVVADVGNIRDAVDALEASPVDVVLVDAESAGESLGDVMRAAAGSAIVAMSGSHEPDSVVGALAAGADSYLLKDESVEDIVGAVVRAAAFGESLVSPRIARHVITRLREIEPSAEPPESLTDREVQVLRLMADGLENRSIAYALDISVGTAKNHVASILNKLGATNRVQAAVFATRRRLT